MQRRRVVVTGMGVVAPCGIGLDAYWQGLLAPPAEGERRVHDFDPNPWFDSPKDARRTDRFAHYDAGHWPIGPDGATAFPAMPQPAGLGLAEAVIASGDCFVECGNRASAIRDALGAQLVDMETAAVAQAAAILGLPWCAIKACTDAADSDSAGSFQDNLAAAANRAARAAEQALALL